MSRQHTACSGPCTPVCLLKAESAGIASLSACFRGAACSSKGLLSAVSQQLWLLWCSQRLSL